MALLTVGACAETARLSDASLANERGLFAEANDDIIEYHIKSALPEQLAIDGLGRLGALDPLLSVEDAAGQVVLRYGNTVRSFKAPAPSAGGEWAALTADMLAAARVLSPNVAALANDRLDEIVIDGSLAPLDPFSRYARPEVARAHRAARDGFAGIGITLEIQESNVRIASVMPDTPAATAGLRAGDRILALNGVPVAQLAADEIRSHLRGPAQTQVQLAVARIGMAQPVEVTVQRTTIVPETVTLKEDAGIAWLRLRAFNQQTAQSLAKLLQQAHSDLGPKLKGIVLDLRDNPGGLLDQSVEVASLFLDGGDVVSTVGRNPQSLQHFAAPENPAAEMLPMAVLIDGGSASASEIVAAALQDAGRAVVIGTSSFGKGTVQTVLRTANDGELTVTWAQIITPNGYFLNTHGVVPTLCTAALEDGSAAVAVLLARKPSPVLPALAQTRAALDDTGWKNLRTLCPPRRGERDVDTLAALQLLADPALYSRVLASMDAPRIAASD